jgi:hypothetical protein
VWVYLETEKGLWTVGYYTPDGTWRAESDWDQCYKAAAWCSYLNGGDGRPHPLAREAAAAGPEKKGGGGEKVAR